jgi:hypothetical protein
VSRRFSSQHGAPGETSRVSGQGVRYLEHHDALTRAHPSRAVGRREGEPMGPEGSYDALREFNHLPMVTVTPL